MSLLLSTPELGDFTNLERQRGGVRDFRGASSQQPPTSPTKKQERLAIIPSGEQDAIIQDVRKLSVHAGREIMDRVLSQKQQQNGDDSQTSHLLEKIHDRFSQVGLHPPTITIRFNNISVFSTVTVGNKQLPTIFGPVKSRIQPALQKMKFPSRSKIITKQRSIIQNASGILYPGQFTLLLGAQQSGKTTFLKTLAGLHRSSTAKKWLPNKITKSSHGLHISYDELTYNGFGLSEFVPERSAAYISQQDLHHGELTVRETLEFSRRCQGSGHRIELLRTLLQREKEMGLSDRADPDLDAYMRGMAHSGKHALVVELMIRILQLEICADTVVGSAMLRGISGGQKKRLTSGEVIVGPARALFADEISTGLDSSTTYTIIQALRNYTKVLDATVLIGLLQPPPEVFELFDNVMLLAAGSIIYHGPTEFVLPFFEKRGFTVPPRRGIADFLVEVALPSDQHKYLSSSRTPKNGVIGTRHAYISPKSLQNEFMKTEYAQSSIEALSHPFQRTEEGKKALAWTRYGESSSVLLRALARRTWTLQKRTKIFIIIRTMQVFLMALIVATLFWRADKNTVQDGNLFFGVLFFSLLYQLLGGISEMHLMCDRLPVAHKQMAMRFYPGFLFALPIFLMRIPYSFLESTLWTFIVYWAVGFSSSIRFLVFWFILFIINAWSVLLFQLIAAVCREDTVSTAVGSFFLLIFINISGFVINASSVPPWWLQGLWTNPFFYAMRALSINEFTSSSWNVPNSATRSILGHDILKFRGFPTSYYWIWIAIGFILATGILNFALLIAALTFLREPKRRLVVSEEALEEHEAAQRMNDIDIDVLDVIERGSAQHNTEIFIENGNTPSTSYSSSNLMGLNPHSFALPQKLPILNQKTHAQQVESSQFSDRPSFSSHAAFEYKKRTAIPYPELVLTFRNLCYSVPTNVDRKETAFATQKARSTTTTNTTTTTTTTNTTTTTTTDHPEDSAAAQSTLPKSQSQAQGNNNIILLQNISGIFRPGILTALMGASGAGKTTLMDCLAGRKTGGTLTGDIRINGYPKKRGTFARVSGYVEQTDVHLPQTSVKEALEFSALLRLPSTVSSTKRVAFVNEILQLVELDKIAGAFVGVPGVSGLTIDQRKRLTMAVELVACPSILFLDEPTSGLDARAASVVMEAIRNTVESGRTVVCTIHQPSIDIFEAFDELMLLKSGGRMAYFGSLGDGAQKLIDYFESIPGVGRIKPRYNPANWMLDVTSKSNEDNLGIDFAEIYRRSELSREMDALISEYEIPDDKRPPLHMTELHVAPLKVQFTANFIRFWRQYARMPEYNLTRLIVTIGVAFVFGSLFWKQGDKSGTVTGVLNIAGALYSSVLFIGITDCLIVQHVFSAQRAVSYRERSAGYYSVLPFALAQHAVEIPYLIVQVVLYSSIVYWMVLYFVDAGKFFLFMLFFFLTLLYFVYFGMMAVALTPAVPLANVFCSFFFGVWNLFCGFLIPEPSMPRYYFWTYYLDPVAWSLYSLAISQLGDLQDPIVTLQGKIMTIPEFLESFFNWHRGMMWIIVAILIGFSLLFSCITVFALKKLNYQRR